MLSYNLAINLKELNIYIEELTNFKASEYLEKLEVIKDIATGKVFIPSIFAHNY